MAQRPRSLQSKKYIAKKRKRSLKIAGIVVFCVAALFSLIVFVLRIDAFQITTIQVSGNRGIETEQVKELVSAHIGAYYLGLIPKTNIFLYPADDIVLDLVASFIRIDGVRLARHGEILEVVVRERVPEAVVCWADLQRSACRFSDMHAITYAPAPEFSGKVYTEFVLPAGETPSQTEESAPFMDPVLFQKYLEIAAGIEKFGFSVSTIYLYDDGDVVLKAYTAKSQETQFFIRGGDSAAMVLGNLGLFLGKAKGVFTQIDLRYGNSVFYKQAGGASSTSTNAKK
ncbi:MAG: hypothetical protein RIT04_35 [Candidatus Parcubacteria bacterium]|jgi:hypothetical protein